MIPPTSLTQCSSLYSLAVLYWNMTNKEAAREHLLKAAALYFAHYPNTIDYACCLCNLALVYKSRGSLESVEEYYLQALSLGSARFPDNLQLTL